MTRSLTDYTPPRPRALSCSAALAGPLEERDPGLESIERFAHRIDPLEELTALGARHQIAALVREVLRKIAHRGRGTAPPPREGCLSKTTNLVRRHIAD